MSISNAVLKRDVEHLTEMVKEIDKKLDNGYVTRIEFDGYKATQEAEFKPIIMTIYGLWSVLGFGVLGVLGMMLWYYVRTVPPGGLP